MQRVCRERGDMNQVNFIFDGCGLLHQFIISNNGKDFPPPTRTTNHNNPSRWLMTKISLPLSLITALECAKVRHWWCRFRNDFFCVIRKSWAFVAGRQSASCRHSDFGGSGNRTRNAVAALSPRLRLFTMHKLRRVGVVRPLRNLVSRRVVSSLFCV